MNERVRNCGKILREVFYWIGRDWSSAAGNVCRPLRKRRVSASEHDDMMMALMAMMMAMMEAMVTMLMAMMT